SATTMLISPSWRAIDDVAGCELRVAGCERSAQLATRNPQLARSSRHPLQRLAGRLQTRIHLQRGLVLLLRLGLAVLLLVGHAQPVVRVGQRRLAFFRRRGEVFLQRLFAAGEVRA